MKDNRVKKATSVSVSFGGHDAAFVDDWKGEAIRILREIADKIESGSIEPGDCVPILDSNGRNIGSAAVRHW